MEIFSVQDLSSEFSVMDVVLVIILQIQDFLTEIKNLSGDNRISLVAGYNSTDL